MHLSFVTMLQTRNMRENDVCVKLWIPTGVSLSLFIFVNLSCWVAASFLFHICHKSLPPSAVLLSTQLGVPCNISPAISVIFVILGACCQSNFIINWLEYFCFHRPSTTHILCEDANQLVHYIIHYSLSLRSKCGSLVVLFIRIIRAAIGQYSYLICRHRPTCSVLFVQPVFLARLLCVYVPLPVLFSWYQRHSHMLEDWINAWMKTGGRESLD